MSSGMLPRAAVLGGSVASVMVSPRPSPVGPTPPSFPGKGKRRTSGFGPARVHGQEQQGREIIDVYRGSSIPFGVLSRSSYLLASVFGRVAEEGNAGQRRSILAQYQLRLMTSLQARAIAERENFVLLLSHEVINDERSLVGVLTISKGLSASGAKDHGEAEIFSGSCVYSLCNMAVKEDFRRRGIATNMLRRAEVVVKDMNGRSVGGESAVVVLSVEKFNDEALRLYEGLGYRIDDSWEDPRWLESVERGSVDVARRILMFKVVQQDGASSDL
jgi:ribosomal protein S18 acetylase RimI-like enzyme